LCQGDTREGRGGEGQGGSEKKLNISYVVVLTVER
jgi:hypothetical protein